MGLVNSSTIYNYNINQAVISDWQGFQVGDINATNPGDEIVIGYRDTLRLLSYPGLTTIWAHGAQLGQDYVSGIYHSNAIFENPQILIPSRNITNGMQFYDGSNGNLAGRVIGNIPDGQNPSVIDLNNDGEDEIVLSNNYTLRINHIVPRSVGINEDYSGIPNVFLLYANYPNPFNAQTIISYDLPKAADVNLEVYDILGRKITTLADERQEAGTHQVIWDGSGVSSGLYFYRLKAGEFADIRKMTLLK